MSVLNVNATTALVELPRLPRIESVDWAAFEGREPPPLDLQLGDLGGIGRIAQVVDPQSARLNRDEEVEVYEGEDEGKDV